MVSPSPQFDCHFSSVILMLEITFVYISLSVKMNVGNVCLNNFVLSPFSSNKKKEKKKEEEKNITFQKEYDLADEYFFDNSKKDISFTQNASTNELCYYVSFKKNLSLAQINKNLQKQYELAAEVCPDFQHRIFPESKFLKI